MPQTLTDHSTIKRWADQHGWDFLVLSEHHGVDEVIKNRRVPYRRGFMPRQHLLQAMSPERAKGDAQETDKGRDPKRRRLHP